MRQISSIMHPRHDDYFEDISHIAEKSSNPPGCSKTVRGKLLMAGNFLDKK